MPSSRSGVGSKKLNVFHAYWNAKILSILRTQKSGEKNFTLCRAPSPPQKNFSARRLWGPGSLSKSQKLPKLGSENFGGVEGLCAGSEPGLDGGGG